MTSARPMPLWIALAPVVLLVALLGADVLYFGEDSSYGSNQIALLLAALFAGALGMGRGTTWAQIRDAIAHSIGTATEAILMLLLIGALSGTWLALNESWRATISRQFFSRSRLIRIVIEKGRGGFFGFVSRKERTMQNFQLVILS